MKWGRRLADTITLAVFAALAVALALAAYRKDALGELLLAALIVASIWWAITRWVDSTWWK